jgi:tetratricopeptide (TPR) repeat protein
LVIKQYQGVLEMDPSYIWARVHLSQAYQQKAMYTEAIDELRYVMATSSINYRHLASLAHLYTESGKRGEAQKLLRDLLEQEKKYYISPYSIAVVYAWLENKVQAFAWLRKGIDQRTGRMVRLRFDPRFKNLRSDPMFVKLLRRINPSLHGAAQPTLATLER